MACEAILDVAVRQFGDRGYEGVSTRAIASAANTVMSSITYHFGSKEGLYLACADHIAAQIARRLQPAARAVGAPEALSRDEACAAILSLFRAMIDLMIGEESREWAGFLIREQQTPGPAFDRLYAGAMADVVELLVRLLVRARPDLTDSAARAMGIALFGQTLVLRSARASVLRVLDRDELAATDRTLLTDTVLSNVACILRSAPLS